MGSTPCAPKERAYTPAAPLPRVRRRRALVGGCSDSWTLSPLCGLIARAAAPSCCGETSLLGLFLGHIRVLKGTVSARRPTARPALQVCSLTEDSVPRGGVCVRELPCRARCAVRLFNLRVGVHPTRRRHNGRHGGARRRSHFGRQARTATTRQCDAQQHAGVTRA